jgi:hypothetical protein
MIIVNVSQYHCVIRLFCPILYLVSVCDRQGRCVLPCQPVREVLNKQLDRMEILECLTLVETRQELGHSSVRQYRDQ